MSYKVTRGANMKRGQRSVWFNNDQYDMWKAIKEQGITSKTFPSFVKDAFHDGIDKLNIEKITKNQIMEQTANTPTP